MANTFKEIESSALKLGEKQRARLASRLIDSLESLKKQDAEKTWLEEIEHRNDALEAGNHPLIPAEEVFRSARKRFS
ncbi:MAG: addiction module protein [Candidatus Cyclonatronum sp.]|uniref:addiction module protein n=1 Tax=Cyclonatronum sp. TaxID=3024185 RepID=UPI0025B92BA6|nr:addiction module protein [Cyclonatronum sp.]MCC5934495.1 addiction module protein [Balneolales bacterium]MCH8487545.1 addiction module protein [Cyclonatronum sp.]